MKAHVDVKRGEIGREVERWKGFHGPELDRMVIEFMGSKVYCTYLELTSSMK